MRERNNFLQKLKAKRIPKVLPPSSIKFKVHLLAFGRGAIRQVEVPGDQVFINPGIEALDAIFHYGQNDHQPQNLPSVSIGDVIELPDGSLHRIRLRGFQRLKAGVDLRKLIGKVL